MHKEKVILVGVADFSKGVTKKILREYLSELKFLVDTAGGKVINIFTQSLDIANNKTYVGSGKLKEIIDYQTLNNIDTIVFDDELTATQIRNLEQSLKVKILDRTNLILDIFAQRAQTAHAKKQVELAQYQYLLPRLTRMWTHLERQKGGIGLRGPGEQEIETDRRIIRNKIASLKKDLTRIDRQKKTQRKNRGKLTRVALVGYTNVGKSTLMNVICKSEIFAENKLFATLDTTVRKVVIENIPFLLSDTVGFIRKLPHHLIESFKSTLDEIREADILLHVVDISHPNFEEQINIVNQTIQEIDNEEKVSILIFNKIDAFKYEVKEADDLTPITRKNYSLLDLKNMWWAKSNPCIFISAKYKTNIKELKELLYDSVKNIHTSRFPYNDFLYEIYST